MKTEEGKQVHSEAALKQILLLSKKSLHMEKRNTIT